MGTPIVQPHGFGGQVYLSGTTATIAWLHLAIPTPTRIESKQSALYRIYLLYETNGDAIIDQVDTWGARTKIWTDITRRKGHHSGPQLDARYNLVYAGLLNVHYSIGLSVRISLEHGEGQGDVVLVAAGGDFFADV